MKLKKPNPLNYFGVRRLRKAPPHFEYATVPILRIFNHSTIAWIEENLRGRYFLGDRTVLEDDGSVKTVTQIGFEKPSELSFFMISYDGPRF